VLEGSLQRQGNRVRVTAELIDARNGFRVWTETYDRELDGGFALQDEIARSVVDALQIKLGVRLSIQEQPDTAVYDRYPQGLFTDLIDPTGVSRIGISVPLQDPLNSSTVSDHTSPGGFDPRHTDTRVTAAPAPTGVTTSARDRTSKAGLRTNKITADVTPAPPATGVSTSVRDRASKAGLRTNEITPDGAAFIHGFVKAAKGEPINGADVQIESRDGKQVFSTVKTDAKGRYISQGLQPGVYRVTLLVNGAVKASIMNTQTKANRPTQLNFDLKSASEAGNTAKGGKHMVWIPARTGSHIGGSWVEVEDSGKAHRGSNVQTVTARNW
jgi:hypothetical protein